ncbi:secretion protein [Planctomycetaceae bacterium SCGC AG-212-D15]|nr:secretion protein [Planctomycetaceae bacterium SCGC AG-212-D15]
MIATIWAMVGITDALPLLVFGGVVMGIWAVLSVISERNSRMQDRLKRHSRPQSLAEIEAPTGGGKKTERFQAITDLAKNIADPMMPKTELEQSELKIRLANAGFRSESAAAVYSGIRLASLAIFFVISLAICLPMADPFLTKLKYIVSITGIGFYLPAMVLWWIRSSRQQEIFLTLPDALDLMVVCVESGLGLDAAMRRVCEEMKDHAKVLGEEISLANFQLQMGRPKREVLHDLGVRTGVDDVRSLAAILIQADRFGSSVAQALRVQSESMRIRRRQIAEEKAAKTAVQMLFPLILFIFPAIFVVLVGPAAIQIIEGFK